MRRIWSSVRPIQLFSRTAVAKACAAWQLLMVTACGIFGSSTGNGASCEPSGGLVAPARCDPGADLAGGAGATFGARRVSSSADCLITSCWLRASRALAAAMSASVCFGSVCASRFHTSVVPFAQGLAWMLLTPFASTHLYSTLVSSAAARPGSSKAPPAMHSANAIPTSLRSMPALLGYLVRAAAAERGARPVHEYPRARLYLQVTNR